VNLDILRTFAKVADTRSLTKAAQLLDKPQPSISRKIAMLERACGGHLFLRTGRGMMLTALGERVFARTRILLQEADGILAEARTAPSELVAEISVGVIPSLAPRLMRTVFFRMQQRHPRITLRIFEAFSGELDDGLDRGLLDIAVLLRGSATLQNAEQSFGNWQTHLIGPAGDAITSAGSIRFDDLEGLPLILPSAPSGARLQIEEIARSRNVRLNVAAEANSGPVTLELIRAGGGYSVSPATAPLSLMSAHVAGGRLQAALLTDPQIHRTLVLRQSPGRGNGPAANEVAQVVAEALNELRGATAGQVVEPVA